MISLELNASWASGLVPIRVAAREAISDCYELTLDVLSGDASLPLTDALRRPATVTVSQGEQRRQVPGIITEMALLGTLPGERYWYRLVLVPRLRLLELTRRSRVFCTEQPVPVGDLLQQVIATADGVSIASSDVAMNLQTTTYPQLDLAVQYTETDLAFLSRRAEYAGIFYFFQTSNGTDQVTFGDANVCFPFVGGSAETSGLSYRPSVGVADTGPAIRSVEMLAHLTPQKAQLNTRDWENPSRLLLVQSDPQAGGLGLHEWEEEDGYTDAAWGHTLAGVRSE
ncbi:MAG TPA: contractile injection system protein, VgrG/Pvc8 family, partial [Rhodanobacter sp.]